MHKFQPGPNRVKRLTNFIGFKEKKILVQSFVCSNFNYCPLVWYFSSATSLQKIEQLQERALRFLYNDHTSSYNDLLLKSDKGTMVVARQRTLCIEIFKTVKHLNPPFIPTARKVKISPNLQLSRFRCTRRDSNMEIYTSSFHLISIK